MWGCGWVEKVIWERGLAENVRIPSYEEKGLKLFKKAVICYLNVPHCIFKLWQVFYVGTTVSISCFPHRKAYFAKFSILATIFSFKKSIKVRITVPVSDTI